MIKQTNLMKHFLSKKINLKFTLKNFFPKYFSLSMTNLQQENFQINNKNHLATFYVK
jgi:hypothetical protein